MPQAQPVAAAALTQFIMSSLDTMNKPQVANKVFSRYPDQTELGWMMEEGMFEDGTLEMVNGQIVQWHEKNKIIGATYVGSFTQIGATNGIRIVLGVGSYENAGAFSSVRSHNQVELPGSQLQGIVKAKSEVTPNAHTIDVYPLNTDLTYAQFSAGLTAGARIMVFTMTAGEGSSGPLQGLTSTTSVYAAQLQKFEEMYEGTFETITNQTYPDGLVGKGVNYVYGASQMDTEDRFRLGIEMSAFLGIQNAGTAALTDAEGNPMTTTGGYWKTIQSRGSGMQHAGEFGIDQFDQLRLINRNNMSGKQYKMLMGLGFSTISKNLLKEFPGGAIVYSNSAAEKAIDFSFSKLTVQGFQYDMKEVSIFSHPDLAGISGYPYSSSCIVTPMATVKDTKTSKGMKPFSILYKNQSAIPNQVSRGWYAMGQTGFYASGGPTNTKKSNRLDFVADCGARTVNAISHVLITETY